MWDQPSGLAIDKSTNTLFVTIQQSPEHRIIAVELPATTSGAPAIAYPVVGNCSSALWLSSPYAVTFVA